MTCVDFFQHEFMIPRQFGEALILTHLLTRSLENINITLMQLKRVRWLQSITVGNPQYSSIRIEYCPCQDMRLARLLKLTNSNCFYYRFYYYNNYYLSRFNFTIYNSNFNLKVSHFLTPTNQTHNFKNPNST